MFSSLLLKMQERSQASLSMTSVKVILMLTAIDLHFIGLSSGKEWQNVILSTVRTLPVHKVEARSTTKWKEQHLGHLINRGQVSLALTRAKDRLIILGG